MGRKVLISFLGVTNYIPCNYYLEDSDTKTDDVRFVQEAIIEQCCTEFDNSDQIHIFITDQAKAKNWQDNGFKDREGNVIPLEGLQTRISKLNTKAEICPHKIIEGVDREEIWKIFNKVFEQIGERDTVFFDITNGFRSLPMLGMVLINYAKALHSITVGGIYYGAFEYLGSPQKSRQLSIEERNVPILNLSQFAELQEWALAASVFSKYGITKLISEQTKQQRAYFDKQEEGNLLDNFAVHMDNLFLNFSTVRGEKILTGEHLQLSESIEDISKSLTVKQHIPPLEGILKKVDEELQEMTGLSNLDNGMRAVKWMIDNGLVQQGTTLIRELIVYYCMAAYRFQWEDYREEEFNRFFSYIMNRDSIRSIKNCLNRYNVEEQIRERDLRPIVYDMKSAIQINPSIAHDFGKILTKIKPLRDNMNHGGLGIRKINEIDNAQDFDKKLQKAHQDLKTLIKKYS